jgi:dTMP kinase
LRPDVTVLLDVPVTEGLGRTSARDELPDRLEAESAAFHERVREAFRELAEATPDRYLVIDASLPPATIHQLIVRRIADFVPELSPDLQPTVQLKVGRR